MQRNKQLLKDLQHLLQSPLYEWYKYEFEDARDEFTDIICGLQPANVKDFVLREQAVGQLEQIRTSLNWFAEKEQELINIIEEQERE